MHFFAGKRVVVTGGAGFLGRAVVARLAQRGADQVFVVRSSDYDLRDRADVRRLFATTRPHIVLHLAAVVGGIAANQAAPGEFFFDNLMMSAQMMEEARLHGCAKFVGVSTVCVYPKHAPTPFREDGLWDGYPEETNAPYAMAKKMLLVQAQAYRQQYGFNAITLLPVNLYGPGDNFDEHTSHVIPALIRKCIEARDAGSDAIEVFGDGTPTREFLFVRDAAEAVVLATERYDDAAPINLGSGHELSIAQLVEHIRSACRYRGGVRWNVAKPNGQPRRRVDTSRAEALGFTALTPFALGLEETVAWYERLGQRRQPPRDSAAELRQQ